MTTELHFWLGFGIGALAGLFVAGLGDYFNRR
jgi:hypothetical protein